MSAVMMGIIAAGLWLIGQLDQRIKPGKNARAVVFAACILGDVLCSLILGQGKFLTRLSLSLFIGCLLLACITDIAICQVYNFVWWISGAAAIALLIGRKPEASAVWEVLLFGVIQMTLFARMYGKADCYAFFVCAIAEAGLGFGQTGFLMHMLVSFLLLAAAQALRRNIGSGGRLKEPVPFLPYITAGFYIMLIFYCSGLFSASDGRL